MAFMKFGLILIAILVLPIVLAYNPPIYVGDPETLECNYYFAGDEKHFNPRPENYTVDIGPTTDFESEEKACEIFKLYTTACKSTGGEMSQFECVCPENYEFKAPVGCVMVEVEEIIVSEDVTGAVVTEELEESKLEYDRILLVILTIAFVSYFLYSRKEIKRLKGKKEDNKPIGHQEESTTESSQEQE